MPTVADEDRKEKENVIYRCMALPLIKDIDILNSFNEIKKQSKKWDHFKIFFMYIDEFWLSKVGVKNFCTFFDLVRLCKDEEDYHRALFARTKYTRPNTWHFLGNVLKNKKKWLCFKYCFHESSRK